ncbi:MAG: NAD-dependent epimerase/dehydratase family protein, partial [Candidatus Nanohaloarchaea archaeon]
MSDKLVIGGSGFIGSHVSNHLAEKNQNVKVLNRGSRPEYLSPDIDYIESDVVNISSSDLEDVDTVFLQSGRTGIGDSLVEPDRYYQDNLRSVIPLLKMLDQSSVEHIVVASTIMVYGPGRYNCDRCGTVFPGKRSEDMLEKGHWEPV